MLLSLPSRLLAVLLGAGFLFAIGGNAVLAQKPTYRSVSHGSAISHGNLLQASHGCPCPCPCPPCPSPAPAEGEGEDVPAPEDDMPEVADMVDQAIPAGPQSAVPNVIGDSISGFGSCGVLFTPFGDAISVCPSGGRKFKITENTSPIPRDRLYYNFHYFDNAFAASIGGVNSDIDVRRHELGVEKTFWCGLASIEVMVPFSNTIKSELDASDADLTDTEFGNVNVALKGILYQDCCGKTLSAGLGVDIPTADDVTFTDGSFFFELENEVFTLSPFVGWQVARPCCNLFTQGFVQLNVPLSDNPITADDGSGAFERSVDDLLRVNIDVSVGYWLRHDCCGNGLALIGELHYTRSLEDEEIVLDPSDNVLFQQDEIEILNATAGVTMVHGCWDVTPAIVVPLLDDPDRFFDWEAAVYVNRRF